MRWLTVPRTLTVQVGNQTREVPFADWLCTRVLDHPLLNTDRRTQRIANRVEDDVRAAKELEAVPLGDDEHKLLMHALNTPWPGKVFDRSFCRQIEPYFAAVEDASETKPEPKARARRKK